MKYIDPEAFKSCTNLKDIYYTGTKAQWEAIDIDDYNEPLHNATIHYIDLSLPASLTAIESEAFAGGGFSSVRIPAGVTFIADDAFGNRTNLTIISVPGSTAETFATAHGFTFVPAP